MEEIINGIAINARTIYEVKLNRKTCGDYMQLNIKDEDYNAFVKLIEEGRIRIDVEKSQQAINDKCIDDDVEEPDCDICKWKHLLGYDAFQIVSRIAIITGIDIQDIIESMIEKMFTIPEEI